MSLNTAGEIAYQSAALAEGLQVQTDPPVCNRCWRTMTPENFAWASVVSNSHTHGRFEFIECMQCTPTGAGVLAYALFRACHPLSARARS
jgi:hypothetical protein